MKRIIFFCCFPPTKTTKTTTTTKMRRFLITLSLLSLLLPLLSTKPLKPTKPQGGNIASPEYVKSNLGTKRNYEPKGGLDTHTPPPNGCRLFHMEYLARHGTRFISFYYLFLCFWSFLLSFVVFFFFFFFFLVLFVKKLWTKGGTCYTYSPSNWLSFVSYGVLGSSWN